MALLTRTMQARTLAPCVRRALSSAAAHHAAPVGRAAMARAAPRAISAMMALHTSVGRWSASPSLSAEATSASAPASEPLAMHETARAGFDVSGGSGLYDRARPSYPDEALDAILDGPQRSKQGEPLKVVELGCGTGISTRALLARAGQRGVPIGSLDAFEPSEGMREAWERGMEGAKSNADVQAGVVAGGHVRCHAGTFESFASAVGEATADVVLVAQAWHWAPDYEAALREVGRALRPGGVLALLWNLEDRNGARWVARLRDMYEAYEYGAPQYHRGGWHAMYATDAMHDFDLAPPLHIKRVVPATCQSVKDRVLSKSYISILPPEQKTVVNTFMDHLLDEPDTALDRKWIDEHNGIFEYPHQTDLYLFTRK